MTKGIITSNLNYVGTVKIKLIDEYKNIINSKELKNSGTLNLMKFFSRALCGENVKSDIPKYIDILYPKTAHGEFNYSSLLKNRVPLTGATWSCSDKSGSSLKVTSCTTLTAIISSTDKVPFKVSTSLNTFKLALKSDSDDILALIQSEDINGLFNGLEEGMSVIIEWVMEFTCESNE